jgi:two-component system OmpR family sensor kinase
MTLRIRLALWNALVIAGAICLLGALTYVVEARSLSQELDESIHAQARNLQSLYQVRASLPPRARERIIPQPSVFSAPAYHVQILDPDGAILERSSGLGGRQLPVNPTSLKKAEEGEGLFESVLLEGQDVRVFTMPLIADEEFVGYAQVARSQEAVEDALKFLRNTLLGAGAGLVVLSMIVAWFLAGVPLQPIGRITRAARSVGLSGRLDQRLPSVRTRDEIGRLVDTFNRMMDRLENAFLAQRRFVGDASHELRTPLTTIRGNLELLKRSGAVTESGMQEALQDVIDESERMSRLVQGLLALARADAGQRLARDPVRLDELVRVVHREAQMVSNGVAVHLDANEPAEVVGDADALKQLLLILVENGVKYTPSGGTVTLDLHYEGGDAVLAVRDTGVGIASDELPQIFERFYRSPVARASGGTGLGLSIARWIAEEHGAELQVASRVGAGTTFTIRLQAQRPRAETNGAVATAESQKPERILKYS